MKKAAKVFLIIGMILGFYAILPIVFGSITIRKLNNASSRDELRPWGILSILFVSTLGGIFVLCVRDEELTRVETKKIVNETGYDRTNDPAEKLMELKSLLDEGIIDQETYQEKKKKYLEDL